MASLRDIASKAGVCVPTVSKVLNNSPAAKKVSPETRERIHRIAGQLNYRRHPIAASLRTSQTRTIGFLASAIPDSHLGPIIKSVQEVLDAHGYHLLISVAEQDKVASDHWFEYFRLRVDGILIGANDHPDELVDGVLGNMAFSERPHVVLLGRSSETKEDVPCVTVDNFAGAREAVRHLVKLGHRKIGYFGGRASSPDNHDRRCGLEAALTEAGIAVRQEWISETPGSVMSDCGYDRARRFLADCPEVTAVQCFNDFMTMGIVLAAREIGRRVPDDLSVVGFDDLHWAPYAQPPLTTVHQPREEMGRQAARLLLKQLNIDENAASDRAQPGLPGERVVVLQPELVVRNSTAPCGSGHR